MIELDRVLEHEIHPLKLLMDCAKRVGARLPLPERARGDAPRGIAATPVVSGCVLRWATLEHDADCRPGRYITRYMTRPMEVLRLGGAVVVWVGGWDRAWPAVTSGVLVILLASARGLTGELLRRR